MRQHSLLKTPILILLSFSFICAQVCVAANNTKGATPKIILIMDDMGNHLGIGTQAIKLPGKVHFAFLPHTPYAYELANLAHNEGKEILLHAPMSNLSSKRLGDGALIPAMNKEKFLTMLKEDIKVCLLYTSPSPRDS